MTIVVCVGVDEIEVGFVVLDHFDVYLESLRATLHLGRRQPSEIGGMEYFSNVHHTTFTSLYITKKLLFTNVVIFNFGEEL